MTISLPDAEGSLEHNREIGEVYDSNRLWQLNGAARLAVVGIEA